ncbi:Ras guanine nucleotide exchange factor bud5 [Coemansia sp. RSA 552]|nr:Ras guanine nucleotide exchange factor bud5 [Coemansia sp. RSA 552]
MAFYYSQGCRLEQAQNDNQELSRAAKILGDSSAVSDDRIRAERWQGLQQRQSAAADPFKDTSAVVFNSAGRVTYGTWQGIVSYLTQVHRPSDTFNRVFFLTFRSFATPTDLAHALVARARELTSSSRTVASSMRLWHESVEESILHNVFLAIKHWYEDYWYPATDDTTLRFLCCYLVNEYVPKCQRHMAKECNSLLRKIASHNPSIDLAALATEGAVKVGRQALRSRAAAEGDLHKTGRQMGRNPVADRKNGSARGGEPVPRVSTVSSSGTRSGSRLGLGSGSPLCSDSESRESMSEDETGQRSRHRPHRGLWNRLLGKHPSRESSSDPDLALSEEDPSFAPNPPFHRRPSISQMADDRLAPLASSLTKKQRIRRPRAHTGDSGYDGDDQGNAQPSRKDPARSDTPDISDLLMATVGVDLSLEAYRRISHIYQVSPVDVACQLTIIESSCYCQIEPPELLNKEFSKGDCSLAVNVRQMSRWCTQITRWASVMILREPTPERRCRMLRYFIDLGIQLLALKNYDAVMAVKGAIYGAAVMRLKRTWAQLPNKYNIMCRRILEAMDPDRNYTNYRTLLRNSNPPLLPFLGLYLTDLTFLDDGNPTYRRFEEPSDLVSRNSTRLNEGRVSTTADSQPRKEPSVVQLTGQTCALFAQRKDVDLDSRSILVNFEKANRLADIIMEVQKFQVEYSGNFAMAIPGLQQYLIEQWEGLDALGYGDESIYNMSLRCEPRAGQLPDPRALPTTATSLRLSRLLPGNSQR